MTSATSSPKIGLALGSGASRGWSHIGVIKALQQEGIQPDIICGTSIGAIIGASYLAGNLGELETWVLNSTRSDVLRFLSIGLLQTGFVDNERLRWFLHTYVASEGKRIEAMPKKFAAVSTDLDTGREVWFTEGPVSEAVAASMAFPGLFPAVRNDHRWLVDGGLVNPVPVSVCHALGADIVLAVNLNSGIIGKHQNGEKKAPTEDSNGGLKNLKQRAKEYSGLSFANHDKQPEAPGLMYAIANSINIFQDRITRSRLAGDPADILLAPRVAHIGMLEFHRAGEAIEEGQRCVQNVLADIRRLVAP